ncbi:MAG: sulfite exporter TauE/SafE family protein [Armatimonadetes bacterium]|nr:sulfite exporter TauE/SafE family protein [Armatimonadota bacterium]
MHLEPWQWIFGAVAALLVGISKTGIPGIGILVVPMLAQAFGSRPSIGIMLPMLIMGDVFAVIWYKKHTQWDKLVGLLPWVVAGVGVGAIALWQFALLKTNRDILDIVIGSLILIMLSLHFAQRFLGEQLTPKSPIGVASTGISAGFATTVSNAAGPIMQIYLMAHKLPKEQFMGTIAWYFFIINVGKLPIYFLLTAINPKKPIVTGSSLLFNIALFPAVLAGVLIGKWLLPRMSQRTFNTAILVLAGIAALRLIVG